jgi:hypothetical protein
VSKNLWRFTQMSSAVVDLKGLLANNTVTAADRGCTVFN